MNKKEQLEAKIMLLENKKAEMEEACCWLLADILAARIDDLKSEAEGC